MKRQITIFLLLLTSLGFSACSAAGPDVIYMPDISATAPAGNIEENNTVESPLTEQPTDSKPVTQPETIHVHNFSDATCSDPGRCDCGETHGDALGHIWNAATCIAPKTCTVCGKTTGKLAAHQYSGGACTVCGNEAPSSSGDTVWIPTKGGKKYHAKASCSNMIDPEKVTKDEAEDLGFGPCKRCYK